mmetsp:Transcript_21812/g.59760  ORF Transcript_21812/g.59760 Transcript_21812/m.59760 type:complete len:80 (+) Transcript_21812:360-599(+)
MWWCGPFINDCIIILWLILKLIYNYTTLYTTDPVVVRPSGAIAQCLEEWVGDVPVADQLRRLLLLEESEHYEVKHINVV